MTSKTVNTSHSTADARPIAAAPPATKELTARILKKRESDRRCQRIKRARTKSRIEYLEETVRIIGNQDATGQVQVLIEKLQGAERGRDELARKLQTIENFLRDDEPERNVDTKSGLQQDHPDTEYLGSSIAGSLDCDQTDAASRMQHSEKKIESQWTDTSDQVQPVLLNGSSSTCFNTSLPGTIDSQTAGQSQPLPDERPYLRSCAGHSQIEQQPCECRIPPREITEHPRINIWRFANDVLSSRFGWPEYCRFLQDEYRDDTPIRAIVEGWDAIEAFGSIHPSWQILKQIDQVLLRGCASKERVAVIIAIQALLLSHIRAEPVVGLPSFYRVRPSQNMASMADSYAINFFPWPGMRERFVFNQHRYCTNEFWNAFLGGLRLTWPYEFRDVYARNVETGLYSVSPMFQHHVSDINCWTMDIDLFKRWPELAADIPAYNRIPRAMSNWIRVPRSAIERTQQASCMNTGIQQVSCMNKDSQQKTDSNSMQQRQPTQPYVLSEDSSAATPYNSTFTYNVSQTVPVLSWAETTTQQPHETVCYFAGVPHTVNVTSAF